MWQQPQLFLPLCQILCHPKSLAYGRKTGFCHDIFNTHGLDCTRLYILYKDIFPWNHDYSFGALVRKASKTCDIKFCKETKTIVFVHVNVSMVKLWSHDQSPINHSIRKGIFRRIEVKSLVEVLSQIINIWYRYPKK